MTRPFSDTSGRLRVAITTSMMFLLVLALAVALPLLAERQEIRRLEEQRLHSLTQNLMLNVTQQLGVLHRSLSTLRDDLAVWLLSASGQTDAQRRLAALGQAIPGLIAIRIIDHQGQVWVSHDAPNGPGASRTTGAALLWVQTPLDAQAAVPAAVRVALPENLPAAHKPGTIELWLGGDAFRLPLLASRATEDTHVAVVGSDGSPLIFLPENASTLHGLAALDQAVGLARPTEPDLRIRLAKADTAERDDPRLAAIGAVESALTGLDHELQVVASRDYDDLYERWWRAVEVRSGLYLLTVLVVLVTLWLLRRNLKDQQRLQDEALARQRLFASIVDSTHEGILITDERANIIEINDAMSRISGYTRQELLGRNPRLFQSGRHTAVDYQAIWQALAEQGHWYGELWNQRRDGEIYPALVTISAVRNTAGKVEHYAAIMNDITALKEQEAALQRFAHQDGLTGLPNRRALNEQLAQALQHGHAHQTPVAIAFIDLDGFKAINDRYGHDMGDRLLQTLAQRMLARLRPHDILARLGGDEFIAVLTEASHEADYGATTTRLLEAVAQPVCLDDLALQVSASIGFVVVSANAARPTPPIGQLLQQADAAMYRAKQAGKNRVVKGEFI